MKVLKPKEITNTTFVASSIAEPDTGETLWSAGTAYTSGMFAIRTQTHRVYLRLISGTTATAPELDPVNWLDYGPTNKWAWADTYITTATSKASTFNITLQVGTVTDIVIYGLDADNVRVQIWETSGGTLKWDMTYAADDYSGNDWMWEFYFGDWTTRDQLQITGLYPYAAAEIKLTFTKSVGNAKVGIIALGVFDDLGLSEYGFKASPVDYSRITTDDFGNTRIVKRYSAKNVVGSCVLPNEKANGVVDTIHKLLSVPCAWQPTDDAKYDYLNTFGLGSADITAMNPTKSRLDIDIKGLI
jgi:hypothetical protein